MNMIELLTQPYPMAAAGGVFLSVVGAAILLGAANMKLRYVALGVGAACAAAATVAFALSHPIAPPSSLQMAALAAAIAFEVLAIAFTGRAMAKRIERDRTLAILAIVSAHFFIMAPAFGPAVVALGALGLVNAAVGGVTPGYALPALWLSDGALKLGAGIAMACG